MRSWGGLRREGHIIAICACASHATSVLSQLLGQTEAARFTAARMETVQEGNRRTPQAPANQPHLQKACMRQRFAIGNCNGMARHWVIQRLASP
ncbi:exported hypothetical protein [Xanthomonas citri pv. citri]|uniref:Uncharacterized protein n=1 Tax=Xanthomonas citri pv. citri TaxID=611301 RepID=A0A0U5F9Z1_XANCI|nr:exported hypothetical protein [Xanthomonas citri pv. citri]CEE19136.1 exported hypothetical protein [Xanthomonas citri pv. citri]CEE20140.1 exported hypothetical protein [Xanthomonas citri pv. citri]CEE28268.1 exported hypothetical protein [Xanthomonas citri pv. citri]CEE30031.1 exported hypothetical protein [Xanthomonas citri pv. citri]